MQSRWIAATALLSLFAAAPAQASEALSGDTIPLTGPTLGVVQKGRLYRVANSEWETFDPGRGALDPARLRPRGSWK